MYRVNTSLNRTSSVSTRARQELIESLLRGKTIARMTATTLPASQNRTESVCAVKLFNLHLERFYQRKTHSSLGNFTTRGQTWFAAKNPRQLKLFTSMSSRCRVEIPEALVQHYRRTFQGPQMTVDLGPVLGPVTMGELVEQTNPEKESVSLICG